MANATATKKGRGAGGAGRGKVKTAKSEVKNEKAAVRPVVTSVIKLLDIEVGSIDRCPFQPRQQFPAEEIKALAESIATNGQIHPIAVRPFFQPPSINLRYELVDGERRFRAVRSLGWKTIRAEVGGYTDSQVRAVVLATALQRKDLNAIEEARAFQVAIDCGDAAGPTELAKQLGLSQGHVSNRLRLLELPENVRDKIISREISPTNARTLVQFKTAPALLDAIIKEVGERTGKTEEIGTSEFNDAVDDAVRQTCERIETKGHFNYQHQCKIPPLKLTDEQRVNMGIIEYTSPWAGSKPTEYATNGTLYNELYKAHEQAAIERAKKKKGRGAGGEGPVKKPLTAAEKKQAAEEEKRKAAERAEKLSRGVWSVAIDWRRRLIARLLAGEETVYGSGVATVGVSVEDTLRLLLYFAASGSYDNRNLLLWNGLVESGMRAGGWKTGRQNLINGLAACDDKDVIERSNEFLANIFWNEERGPEEDVPDEAVLAIADHLSIDFAAAWQKEALDKPWTEQWLELRTKEQLAELAKSWKVEAGGSKADMVARLMRAAHRQKPPAELLKPKKPK